MTVVNPPNGAVVPIPYSARQLNPIDEAIMRAALAADDKRLIEYNRALAAYNGNFPKPFKTAAGQPDDNVIVNIIAPIVDVGVHFLFGTPPEVTLPMPQDDDEDGDDSEGEQDQGDPGEDTGGNGGDASDGAPTSAQHASDMAGTMNMADGESAPPVGTSTGKPAAAKKPQAPKLTPEQQEVADAQEWLDECLRLNNFPVFCLDLATNGDIGGTPYSRIYTTSMYPNKEDPSKPYPRVQVLDPACMSIAADARDIDRVMAYVWTYNAGPDPVTKQPRYERQIVRRVVGEFVPAEGVEPENVEMWEVVDQHATSADGDWITDSTTDWPYPWSPILHSKNLPNPNSVYGRPGVTTTMINANRQLNFSLSNSQRIERYYGHKRIWIKGMAGQEVGWLDTGTAVIIDIPSPDAEIGQIEPSNDGGQAASRRAELYSLVLEESSTPTVLLGRTDATSGRPDPSGVSLKVRLIPAIAKLETKKKTYGPHLIELCRRLLELGGFAPDILPVLEWKEQLPVDPIEERNALKLDHDMGIVSLETIAEKLDYDWESEKAKIDKENEEDMQHKFAQAQLMMANQSAIAPPPTPAPVQPAGAPPTPPALAQQLPGKQPQQPLQPASQSQQQKHSGQHAN